MSDAISHQDGVTQEFPPGDVTQTEYAVTQSNSITVEEVIQYMGTGPFEPGSNEMFCLEGSVASVNDLVPKNVPQVRRDPEKPWSDSVRLAALMLASRFFQRRNSPSGIASYTETGPAYVARWDPDQERLLGIGAWAPPMVA